MIIKVSNIDEAVRLIQMACRQQCVSDVAAGAGVSTSTVRRWRDHPMKRPQLKIFIRLADYFGYEVSMQELMKLAA